jgi:hypothetical protein
LSRRRAWAAYAGLALALLLGSRVAAAAPCGVPDVDATYPANGAVDVPSNAILSAHYSAPPDYAGELASLTRSGVTQSIGVTFDEAEALLRAVPVVPLAPGDYSATFPALRGTSSGTGRGRVVSFTVSGSVDGMPPTFEGLAKVSWDLSREEDPCTDTAEDRYIFDLELGQASDDSDPSLLAVLVFETERPSAGATAPPLAVGIHPFPRDGKLRVVRPSRKAGKTCFAAVTRDLAGFVSGGGSEEACVETIEPPWFEGCSIGRPRSRAMSVWLTLLVLLSVCRRARASSGRATNAG